MKTKLRPQLTRFHLRREEERTTVTLDTLLSDLVALRLGQTPATKQAHAAVRAWLQRAYDDIGDHDARRISQALQRKAALFIATPALVKAYEDWLIATWPQ